MFESELEKKLAEIRLLHSLKKMSIQDILEDGDPVLDRSFSPFR